ncbi:hypothetical protein Tcan_10180 [Toxocara canis]|uniref:Uncharacterized protein n=1 Tax=Toxocara canis TaxID=6265 RepID=A0A0B2V261_TOXCA|nr:hypothetical protein Tcan_10180 [Toxocara canis]
MKSAGLAELRADLAVMQEQLKAKRTLFKEAVSILGNVPRHPSRDRVVPSVLGARVKCAYKANADLMCRLEFAVLFDHLLCVAVRLRNQTTYRCTVTCMFVCESAYTPVAESSTAIFDSLEVANCVPARSERTVISACPSGVLIDGTVQLLVECEVVGDANPTMHPSLLAALPSICEVRASFFSFFVPPDVDRLYCENLDINIGGLGFAEAERLYQSFMWSFFSRNADVMPSEALKALRRLGGFTDMDFGYWRLSMGDVGTRWQGMAIFCALSDISPLCARCRVFVRREEDLVRLLGKVCDERR